MERRARHQSTAQARGKHDGLEIHSGRLIMAASVSAIRRSTALKRC
jgi:hypothetical protein